MEPKQSLDTPTDRPDSRDQEKLDETRELLTSAFLLARSLGITTVMVQEDEIGDKRIVENVRLNERVIWIRSGSDVSSGSDLVGDIALTLPESGVTRLGQINLGLFLVSLNRLVGPDERVLGISGTSGSRQLDTLIIARPARDFPFHQHPTDDVEISTHLARVLEIALRLANQGREGSPIGTIFVLGEVGRLSHYLSQLILNPMKGHSRRVRSIYNSELFETIRELAAMDGAFVIDRHGTLESAATYLNAPLERGQLAAGLGARHAAALSITAVTDATTVVVSASSGATSVYRQGRVVLTLERR